jgi:hypothetical protein
MCGILNQSAEEGQDFVVDSLGHGFGGNFTEISG